MNRIYLYFLIFSACYLGLFYGPLKELMHLSLSYNAIYSHIVLIPIISGYFLITDRKEIFSDPGGSSPAGIPLIIIGSMLYVTGSVQEKILNQNDYLSLMTFSAVLFLIGGFLLIYGHQAFKKVKFPLLFLFFMVPVSEFIMAGIVSLLLKGSSEIAEAGFALSAIPYFREGEIFHLSNFTIYVADECSGIRSSLSLFIASIIAGHMFLKTPSKKIILSLSVIPIALVRNGFRIVMLSLLGNYVDGRILSSDLHRKGGIPLFILTFALLLTICWYLRRSENRDVLQNKMSIKQTGA